MGARRAARSQLGRGAAALAPTRSRRRSSSSATASSRSTASATPTSAFSTRRRRSSQACGRRRSAARDHGQLPRGAGAARVRQRCVRRASRRYRDAARRVPVRRPRSVSGSVRQRTRPATRPIASHIGADRRRDASTDAARARGRRDRPAPVGDATVRDRATGVRRPARAGGYRRSSSARATAIASSRRRSSVAAFSPTSTKASGSSRPTKSRTRSRCCGIWPTRCPTCAPPRSCDRASSGSRTPALARLAPRLAEALIGPRAGRVARAASRRRPAGADRLRAAVPRWLRVGRSADAGGAARPRSGRDGVRLRNRGASGGRQARENLKKLRGMVGRFQNRGYATLARVADHLDRAGGRRRVERGDRRARRGQPDDRARRQGPGVPDRVSRQPRARHRRRARADPGGRGRRTASASVAIADYQSEADEDAQAREREETKRLLYVRSRARAIASTCRRRCRKGVPDGPRQSWRSAAGIAAEPVLGSCRPSPGQDGPMSWTATARARSRLAVDRRVAIAV